MTKAHDILMTTVPGREPSMLVALSELVESCSRSDRFHHRITVHIDGPTRVRDELLTLAQRIIVRSEPQGITLAVYEWIEAVACTRNYYGGASVRTSQLMCAYPELLTIIQDDVRIDPDMIGFVEQHHAEIFSLCDFFSGYNPPEHPRQRLIGIGGRRGVKKVMGCAAHLCAPFTTFRSVMPVAKNFGEQHISDGGWEYAPEIERGHPSGTPRLGSRLEHWLQGDAPYWRSGATRRGCYIVPGMVSHRKDVDSTWNAS